VTVNSIFISYRRADCPDSVARIFGELKSRLRNSEIFYDHKSIPLGEEFPEMLRQKVAAANIVLVVIGPKWVELLLGKQTASIDHVREEVRLALQSSCEVIPVLVGGAKMPSEADLAGFPELSSLRNKNAQSIPPDPDFEAKCGELVEHLERTGFADVVGSFLAGRYKVIRKIGEGGMGEVYEAEQTIPLHRRVAVKLIKPGMDSKEVLARFDAEKQALAVMDHPNVCRVFDGGVAPNHRPFFVMEFVKGVPITEYCDEHKLDPKQRLEMFFSVCQAVQHAHQKGIIHRDIKPKNVLVEIVDGKPSPKVIDFGLAKALGHKLTDQSFYTEYGKWVGTLEYSSPEQAEGRYDVDTLSDVYSLGVLLYELLVGAAPFTRAELEDAGEKKMREIVAEGVKTKPSTKLSSSKNLPTIAANRRLDPAQLTKLVRGELDWITMKALEKDRDRRYETALGLARDVRRYLADEVVEARPPSLSYRVKKFVRRHKGHVIGGSFILLALIGGTMGTGYGVIEANNHRTANSLREQAERDRAIANSLREQAEKDRASAIVARDTADNARQEAEASNRRELKAKQEIIQAREMLARLEYARTIDLAHREWKENNCNRARDLLAITRIDFRGWEWDYVHRLCHSDLLTIRGHSDQVYWAVFDRKDSRLLTCGGRGEAIVWNVSTGQQLLRLKGHKQFGMVNVGEFSPDGTRIVTGGEDGMAKLWDAQTGAELATLERGNDVSNPWVFSAAFSSDGTKVITAGQNLAGATLSDGHSGKFIRRFVGNEICSAAFSPDGTKVVTGAKFGSWVSIWETDSGNLVCRLKTPIAIGDSVFIAEFSPDGKRVVTGSDHGTVAVWDANTGEAIFNLKAHLGRVSFAAFSPDGARILTAGNDGIAKLWDHSGMYSVELKGHAGAIRWAAFSPDGIRIVTAGRDGKVKVWDSKTANELTSHHGHTGVVNAVTFSWDGNKLVSAGEDFTARVWMTSNKVEVATLCNPEEKLGPVALNGDGSRMLQTYGQAWPNRARIWDLQAQRRLVEIPEDVFDRVASFSPDGLSVLLSGREGLKFYNSNSGIPLRKLGLDTWGLQAVCFSEDGSSLIGVEEDGSVRIYEVVTGAVQHRGHVGNKEWGFRSIHLNRDKDAFAVCEQFGKVYRCQISAGNKITSIQLGRPRRIKCSAFSPNGLIVATGYGDRLVHLWDAMTGVQLGVLQGHTHDIRVIAFCPDGNRIITGDEQGTVKLWDTQTGTDLLTLSGHTDEIVSVAFSGDGHRLVTCSVEGTTKVWDSSPVNRAFFHIAPRPRELHR
jgi:WD40 repeat protein/serine/threonine protein kinase